MRHFHPWFMALQADPIPFRIVMAELGIEFEGDWAYKPSIVDFVNQLCKQELSQKKIWQRVENSKKGLPEKYDFLFSPDPQYQRKRSWCSIAEAWYAVALCSQDYERLHLWLCWFNLGEGLDLIKAKRVVVDGAIVVNGIHFEGSGVVIL